MNRNERLREILDDQELIKKYKLRDLSTLSTSPPYHIKAVEVLSVVINEIDNNLSNVQIYNKLKNIHKIS
ncbi:hypothetical protein [Myroides odoratimimus]|uniref:hypothetical protein n=1 Tax=Myroides odoratimimus TaxID=76832 RepID=UPI0025754BBC|nr:hypothetical protein [Myroides odoratimimus]MDM1530754.1 hypothetical protein [Myroides odoratimimus]